MLVNITNMNYKVAKESKEIKKRLLKKGKIQNSNAKNEELFSFDNEIVIGVTRKQESTKQIKNKKNNKEHVQNSNSKQGIKNNKTSKKNSKKISKKEKVNKKKKRITYIVKYTMIATLFLIVIICAMFSPLFNIKSIQVIGNEKIKENEIISLSQIIVEENIFKIRKKNVIRKIKENAYIDSVEINRKFPSTITITINERNPEYMLEYAGGYVYLDKQGYMLEINSQKLELPILQGTETCEFEVGSRMVTEDLEKLDVLIKIIELAKVNELSNLITRIDIENKDNIKLIFETEDKVAYLGDSTNLIDKLPIIKKILEENEQTAGEIFVNMDLNKENPIFRERV